MNEVTTRLAILAAVLAAPLAPIRSALAQPRHPLEPLSASEIRRAARIVRASPSFPSGAMFSTIVLHEPPKEELLAYHEGARVSREAFAAVMDRATNHLFEAIVDLEHDRVTSWKEVVSAQPPVTETEYDLVPTLVKHDSRWRDAIRRRGMIDPDRVHVDVWAVGESPPSGHRLLRALAYLPGTPNTLYARPIEGVVALVDVTEGRVTEVLDTGVRAIPPPTPEWRSAREGASSHGAAPTNNAAPTAFTLNGHEVRWQRWHFRFSLHPREGLVLHTVAFDDGDTLRSVLYRGALSEMVVPYADPDPAWRWRSAFDVGEYGLGKLAGSLTPGVDAPPGATLVDAVFADDSGNPVTLKRAVAIYTRDGGLLWKHYDGYSGHNESRRARELVVSFVASVGNYDYGISWIFHEDGVLEWDAALTGIVLPKGADQGMPAEKETTGHLIAPGIIAVHHQHFFCLRLDMDVDGASNAVAEMNTRALPIGPANPSGNAFETAETLFRTEREAARRVDASSARLWKIFNPSIRNAVGHHPAYLLMPGANTVPFADSSSSLVKRAGFVTNQFWATRYRAGEMNAAGSYPNQSSGGDGLPRWMSDNETIESEDVVVWYTLGITHVPREEEWPVMPVTHVGFRLVPDGFFARNPTLDARR